MITADEFKTLARPVSIHMDEKEVMQFVDECEDMFIIPAIGYGNFKAALTESTFDATFNATFNPTLLIEGGEWEDKDACGCEKRKVLRYCKGLKATLAYYVYAKMLRSDGSIISRAGFVRHNDEYASHVDDGMRQYNDVMNIADKYMGDCLAYMRKHTVDKVITPLHTSRARIKAIGD